ncbi:MAG: transposase [Candidatus Aminicenantes bacterium]|jgi:putative transposase
MPRFARNLIDNEVYHIVDRGNNKQVVFSKQQDYKAFVDIMFSVKQKILVKIYAFCLMPNHFHVVLTSADGRDISRWVHRILTSHANRYHRHYKSCGHIWQGRFKNFMIQDDIQLKY